MIYVSDLEEVMDIMLDAIEDEDSVNFVADQDVVRTLMQIFCFNTDITPDLIQFDSEEDDYYYFSLDRSDEEEITFSIYNAIGEDGEFIGMAGLLLVDEDVPEEFEEEVSEWNIGNPIRVVFESEDDEDCDGDCDNCPHEDGLTVLTDDDDNIHGFHKEWKNEEDGVKSYYFFSFHSSDEDTVLDMLRKFR